MAVKKLGMSTLELNMHFKDINEANKYAKRLREYIRSICKNKANSGWYAQAMLCISNTKGSTCFQYYEHNGKPGRPQKKKKFYYDNQELDYHMHILLVSNPDYTFRDVIKKYIDKNWARKSSDEICKVYKKNTNIGIAEYYINQSDIILFCNYNFTNENGIPKEYTLRKLYNAYMKERTSYVYCRKYSYEERLNISEEYRKLRDFYFDITKEQDNLASKRFINSIRISKIAENKNNQNNKVQSLRRRVVIDNSLF
jgi:hypothetical protein